jgi:uncharacterized protein (TIGR02147 family)
VIRPVARKVGQRECTGFHEQVLNRTAPLRYIDRVKTNVLSTPAQPTAATSFRLFLQEELGRRCAKNSQYSLRAFARYLAIDHATISQLLRGKRPLTARTILKLGTRLGLDRTAIDRYVAHEARWGRDATTVASFREVQQLASDTASVLSEWHHYAILELTRLHDFKPDTRWIARVLGIAPDQVNLALSRLIRLGLLEMADRGRWIDKSGDITTSLAEFSQIAVRKLSEQVRRLFLSALEALPEGSCEQSSTTLAICTSRLPNVLERIDRFRRELIALFECDSVRDDVYRLEIAFFPVTNLQCDKENTSGPTRDAVADPGQGPR